MLGKASATGGHDEADLDATCWIMRTGFAGELTMPTSIFDDFVAFSTAWNADLDIYFCKSPMSARSLDQLYCTYYFSSTCLSQQKGGQNNALPAFQSPQMLLI